MHENISIAKITILLQPIADYQKYKDRYNMKNVV